MGIFILHKRLFGKYPYSGQNHLRVIPLFWSNTEGDEAYRKRFHEIMFCWEKGALEIDIPLLGTMKHNSIVAEMNALERFIACYMSDYRADYNKYLTRNNRHLSYAQGAKIWRADTNTPLIVTGDRATHSAYTYSTYRESIWYGIIRSVYEDGTIDDDDKMQFFSLMDRLLFCWASQAVGIDLFFLLGLSNAQIYDALLRREAYLKSYINAHEVAFKQHLRNKYYRN